MWNAKRVFFLTPESCKNDMYRGGCPAQSIVCVVVDEAHRATGDYAFCAVIKTKRFRVVALSATPGENLMGVQQIIDNLMITHVEIRSEEAMDVRDYVNKRKVDLVVVPPTDLLKKLQQSLAKLMEPTTRRLVQMGAIYDGEPSRLTRGYLQTARASFKGGANVQQNGQIQSDFALAMSLAYNYELLCTHGILSLAKDLHEHMSADKNSRAGRLLKSSEVGVALMDEIAELMDGDKFKDPYQSHPKLKLLEDCILEHFKKCADKLATRVMVFSSFRNSVFEIVAMLEAHKPAIRPATFIGQSAGKGRPGLRQKEQLAVVTQFREGTYNVMVATSVGEEGLDIGDVDLIICFDSQASTTRMVQRMGRTGRKRDGRVVQLVSEGTEHNRYKKNNNNQSRVHKDIIAGAKKLKFHPENPRMLPPGRQPFVKRMKLLPASRPATAASSKRGRAAEDRKSKDAWALTTLEQQFYDAHYAPFDASESVSLTRYMHQQETDAVAHLIDPSPRRSVFVSVMQLGTKLQQDGEVENYVQGLTAFLDLDDVAEDDKPARKRVSSNKKKKGAEDKKAAAEATSTAVATSTVVAASAKTPASRKKPFLQLQSLEDDEMKKLLRRDYDDDEEELVDMSSIFQSAAKKAPQQRQQPAAKITVLDDDDDDFEVGGAAPRAVAAAVEHAPSEVDQGDMDAPMVAGQSPRTATDDGPHPVPDAELPPAPPLIPPLPEATPLLLQKQDGARLLKALSAALLPAAKVTAPVLADYASQAARQLICELPWRGRSAAHPAYECPRELRCIQGQEKGAPRLADGWDLLPPLAEQQIDLTVMPVFSTSQAANKPPAVAVVQKPPPPPAVTALPARPAAQPSTATSSPRSQQPAKPVISSQSFAALLDMPDDDDDDDDDMAAILAAAEAAEAAAARECPPTPAQQRSPAAATAATVSTPRPTAAAAARPPPPAVATALPSPVVAGTSSSSARSPHLQIRADDLLNASSSDEDEDEGRSTADKIRATAAAAAAPQPPPLRSSSSKTSKRIASTESRLKTTVAVAKTEESPPIGHQRAKLKTDLLSDKEESPRLPPRQATTATAVLTSPLARDSSRLPARPHAVEEDDESPIGLRRPKLQASSKRSHAADELRSPTATAGGLQDDSTSPAPKLSRRRKHLKTASKPRQQETLFDDEAEEGEAEDEEGAEEMVVGAPLDHTSSSRRHRRNFHEEGEGDELEEEQEEEGGEGDEYDLEDSFINDGNTATEVSPDSRITPGKDGRGEESETSVDMGAVYRQSIMLSPEQNPLFKDQAGLRPANRFKLAFGRRTPPPDEDDGVPGFDAEKDEVDNPYSPRTKADSDYFERLEQRERRRIDALDGRVAGGGPARQRLERRAGKTEAPLTASGFEKLRFTNRAALLDDDKERDEAGPVAGEAEKEREQDAGADVIDDLDLLEALAAAEALAADGSQPVSARSAAATTTAAKPEFQPPTPLEAKDKDERRSSKRRPALVLDSDDDDDFEPPAAKNAPAATAVKQEVGAAAKAKVDASKLAYKRKAGSKDQEVVHSSGGSASPPRTQTPQASCCSLLVCSRELQTGGPMVARLRDVHKIAVNVVATGAAGIIISHRIGVLRISQSDVVSWHTDAAMMDRLRIMQQSFVRAYVVVEKDRDKPEVEGAKTLLATASAQDAEAGALPTSGTASVGNSRMQAALARLTAAKLLVVCTNSLEDTADFLCRAVLDEQAKGYHIPRHYTNPLTEAQKTAATTCHTAAALAIAHCPDFPTVARACSCTLEKLCQVTMLPEAIVRPWYDRLRVNFDADIHRDGF